MTKEEATFRRTLYGILVSALLDVTRIAGPEADRAQASLRGAISMVDGEANE